MKIPCEFPACRNYARATAGRHLAILIKLFSDETYMIWQTQRGMKIITPAFDQRQSTLRQAQCIAGRTAYAEVTENIGHGGMCIIIH